MWLRINRNNIVLYFACVLNISNVKHLFEIEVDRVVFGSAAPMDPLISAFWRECPPWWPRSAERCVGSSLSSSSPASATTPASPLHWQEETALRPRWQVETWWRPSFSWSPAPWPGTEGVCRPPVGKGQPGGEVPKIISPRCTSLNHFWSMFGFALSARLMLTNSKDPPPPILK